MYVTWDDDKQRLNLKSHHLDFADHEDFDWENAVILPAKPGKRGEPRFRAVGLWGAT
jgi:uncharacterized DUF497 family protein